jgi:type II secretory pathway component PulC
MKSLLSENIEYKTIKSEKINIDDTLGKIDDKYDNYKKDLMLFNDSYDNKNRIVNKKELFIMKEKYESELKLINNENKIKKKKRNI